MEGIKIYENQDGIQVDFEQRFVDYDVNDVNQKTLETVELAATEATVEYIFAHIATTPFVSLIIKKDKNLRLCELECIDDYFYNMKEINEAVKRFIIVAEKGAKSEELDDEILVTIFGDEARKSYFAVQKMINKLLPYFEACSKIEQVCNDELSKKTFLRIVTGLNKKVVMALDDASKFVNESNEHFLGDKEVYDCISNSFKEIVEKMDIKYLQDDLIDDMLKVFKKVPAAEKSASEIERELYIEKANNLYEQLYLDWMRDLEKQIPFSAKDRYNSYLTKFKKFNESFEMPLVKTTSTGKAKEACSQINNLMNYISDISSGAYTTSVYDEK